MTTFFVLALLVRRRRRRLRHRREVEHARGMHSRDRQKQTEEQSRASRGSKLLLFIICRVLRASDFFFIF